MTVPAIPAVGPAARSLVQVAVIVGLMALSLSWFAAADAVQGPWHLKAAVLARMALLVLLATWFLKLGGQTWADVGLARPRRLWLPLAAAPVGVLLTYAVLAGVVLLIFPPLGLSRPATEGFLQIRGDLSEYLFWAFPVAWGSAAFGEEMLLRGFVLDRLERLFGGGRAAMWAAIVAQAALFGSFHLYQGVGGALVTGLVGLSMGLAWAVTGRNLWTPILMHGLIDFTSMTAIFLSPASV